MKSEGHRWAGPGSCQHCPRRLEVAAMAACKGLLPCTLFSLQGSESCKLVRSEFFSFHRNWHNYSSRWDPLAGHHSEPGGISTQVSMADLSNSRAQRGYKGRVLGVKLPGTRLVWEQERAGREEAPSEELCDEIVTFPSFQYSLRHLQGASTSPATRG